MFVCMQDTGICIHGVCTHVYISVHMSTQIRLRVCVHTCTFMSACASIVVHEAVECFFRALSLPGRTWHAADEEV